MKMPPKQGVCVAFPLSLFPLGLLLAGSYAPGFRDDYGNLENQNQHYDDDDD